MRPMDCSPPESSVRGILQAGTLGWAAISFSRSLPDPGMQERLCRLVGLKARPRSFRSGENGQWFAGGNDPCERGSHSGTGCRPEPPELPISLPATLHWVESSPLLQAPRPCHLGALGLGHHPSSHCLSRSDPVLPHRSVWALFTGVTRDRLNVNPQELSWNSAKCDI